MADQYGGAGPKYYGQSQSPIEATIWGSDPRLTNINTKTPLQQLGQSVLQPAVLANLFGGWKAPSIAPFQREANRQFQQEVVPTLLNNVAAGGSEGGYLRGLQGAGSDLQSKLAALQSEQEFKLQQQRQEQLPKLFELAQAQNFQPHLSNRPIDTGNYEGKPQTAEETITEPAANIFANVKKETRDWLAKTHPDVYKRLSQFVSPAEKTEAALPKTPGQQALASRKLEGLLKKAKLTPTLEKVVRDNPKYEPMIEALLARKRGSRELKKLIDEGDLEERFKYWEQNPALPKALKIARIIAWPLASLFPHKGKEIK